MNLILQLLDTTLLTPYVYPDTWSEDNIVRQAVTTFFTIVILGWLLYLLFATFSFYFMFDHSLMKDPKFLTNQVRNEIRYAVVSIFFMTIPSLACFLFEIRGYSKLYLNPMEYGWAYLFISIVCFLLFTDLLSYIIHRACHESTWLYKNIHKPHHRWIIPTPYASHSIHPVDGFLQSIPFHLFVFLFPFNKVLLLVLIFFVNFWAISLHDSTYAVPAILESVIIGSAHHTDHHGLFFYNYGQYFTFCDKLFGTYMHPKTKVQ